ncbi:MAG: hypothetical protein CMJ83_02825 [Planctomycetes bacterium]|nr:hypothetical protein [Planctomycetota bacterium]
MKKVFCVFGVVFMAQLIFVGLVHVLIRVQGKNSAETMESLHAMPVVGGFFFPPEGEEELSKADAADLKSKLLLRESLELWDLPTGMTAKELEALAHELADGRTAVEQERLDMQKKKDAVDSERRELENWREDLKTVGAKLEKEAYSLEARREELDQQQVLVLRSEEKNLKILRATFEKMSPQKAAIIFKRMIEGEKPDAQSPDAANPAAQLVPPDVDSVAKILKGMSERNSAKILQELDPNQAVQVTKRMQAITAEKNTTAGL